MESKIDVLIIAYRRPENLKNILEICSRQSCVGKIYISVDGPKLQDEAGRADNRAIIEEIEKFRASTAIQVETYFSDFNKGCAISILTSIDWAFRKSNELIILEDDCLPNDDFFGFMLMALPMLDLDQNLWLVSGNQFAPPQLCESKWFLSKYPLIWGWGTNSQKWTQIKLELRNHNFDWSPGVVKSSFAEKRYWTAGAIRCINRDTDAWDILLASKMLIRSKYALNPPFNLVSNVGFDSVAVHTNTKNHFSNFEYGNFPNQTESPTANLDIEKWLRLNLYKISNKHLLTTTIHNAYLRLKKNSSREMLYSLWDKAQINN